MFGVAPLLAMGLLLASTGFYTALGGVRASSYIEFIQTLIMVLALVCAVPVVLAHTGGLTALGEYVGSIEPRVTGWWFTWKELLAFGMAFGFGITAAPYEMTRYYSMRDVATVRYAIGISMGMQVLIGSSVMILGIGIRGIYPYLPFPDQASSIMAATVMPPLLGALFLIAMLSAIMSTVNSILLVTGGAFAHDLYKRLVNPAASQRRLVWVNRLSIVVLGVLPFWMATAAAGRRAGHRHRAGQVHRQLLLRAGGGRPQLAARHQGGRDLRAMVVGFVACLAWTFTFQRTLRLARHRLGGGGRGDERAGLRGGEPRSPRRRRRRTSRYSSTITEAATSLAHGGMGSDPVTSCTRTQHWKPRRSPRSGSTSRGRCSIGS